MIIRENYFFVHFANVNSTNYGRYIELHFCSHNEFNFESPIFVTKHLYDQCLYSYFQVNENNMIFKYSIFIF